MSSRGTPNKDLVWRVNRIIRLPLLDATGNPGLAEPLERCKQSDDWERDIEYCRRQHKEADFGLQPDAEYLMRGICHICEGAFYHAREEWQHAIDSYRRGEQIFQYGKYDYGYGIALMALGLAHQVQGKWAIARRLYERSHQALLQLRKHYELKQNLLWASQCRVLCGRLDSMKYRVGNEGVLQLPVVLFVGEVTAGEPIYLPGEQYVSPTEVIVLDGTKYQLRNLKSREPIKFNLDPNRPGREYFVVAATGDSMIGANILPDDLLLVRKQNQEPYNHQIAVFQDEDSGSVVKRFRHEANNKWLESANPAYGPLSFSPNLRTLGVVIAILDLLEE